ncbi:hypothetical protein Talka_02139 [Tepidimonas alkaliphilus]|uniref:DUF2946 domain-containing protein n=1 Tax=Tepidimonas alkaliphilus TaxID=2588942 RepID=A0A554W4J6_9BURK|nr:hypothetical protein [Tepidimonas alkaliphilus]TSE18496.1 hypothetical protein Talka_02139 [Tepidimonas alkaliphilus]
MQSLRNTRRLARLVLVWFALTLGAAVVSPLVKPEGLHLVCSGSAVKLVAGSSDDDDVPIPSKLDCPLCGGGAVPLLAVPDLPRVAADTARPQHLASHGRTAYCRPVLPARGPPILS